MAVLGLQPRNFIQFPNVGDTVKGAIVSFFQVPTRYNTIQRCIEIDAVLEEDRREKVCIGCTANLALYLDQLTEGMMVRITFMGNQKNPKTGNTYKEFSVEVLDSLDGDDIPFK